MKRYFLLLLFALVTFSLSAQDAEPTLNHLTFKGIEIDGHVDDFVTKLLNQGFEHWIDNEDNNWIALKGPFAGSKREVVVCYTPSTKSTYMVMVSIERSQKWSTLKATYIDFKQLLTEKYGEGNSYEYFEEHYNDGDGYEIMAIDGGNATYKTFFEAENGRVKVAIGSNDIIEGRVYITYFDKQNASLNESEERAIKLSDL